MTKILASSLSDKNVVSADGDELGNLKDVLMDFKTGRLVDLVVEPDMNVRTESYRTDDGYLLLPFSVVKAIKEVIIVNGRAAREEE
ncbi:MAG: hypothetical protein MAG715_00065 [Methanonatronarchaeales archaeon]|nr:hypothetical protein [Methanonatronarchaeales archaeon]